MLCYRLRHWHSNPLFVVLSFFIAAGLVLHLKTLYDNHQKYLRIMDYQESVDKLSNTLEHVDAVTNRISVMRKRIVAYIEAQHKKNDTNVS